jgi:hypothetical protein
MNGPSLQEQCEIGQRELMRMEYLQAEKTLAAAEKQAWESKDFDTLARLLLPLQEARRQRRQRCGEGIICLDIIADGPNEQFNVDEIVGQIPHGQILIAGWGSTAPALKARQLQAERGLYLDVFLAAAYEGNRIEIDSGLQTPIKLELSGSQIPPGRRSGTAETYALTMSWWERLHTPFLAAAKAQSDPIKRIEGFRKAIEVDYACELAHQYMADVIKSL